MGKAEIGKIFGIPIVLDFTFVLLAVLFGFNHFRIATFESITYGVALVTGVSATPRRRATMACRRRRSS